MFEWAYYPRGLIHTNIYFRRSDAILKQLKKHDIRNVKVSRHHLGDWLFYVLEFNRNNSDKYVDEKDIAKALDIPTEWVYFIHIDVENSISIYWIDEEKLHDKYLDDDGELVFDGWSMLDEDRAFTGVGNVQRRLIDENNDLSVRVGKENEYLFIFNSNYGIPSLAKALNIPKHIITDVSCQDAGDLDFIIPLDKVRKEC